MLPHGAGPKLSRDVIYAGNYQGMQLSVGLSRRNNDNVSWVLH